MKFTLSFSKSNRPHALLIGLILSLGTPLTALAEAQQLEEPCIKGLPEQKCEVPANFGHESYQPAATATVTSTEPKEVQGPIYVRESETYSTPIGTEWPSPQVATQVPLRFKNLFSRWAEHGESVQDTELVSATVEAEDQSEAINQPFSSVPIVRDHKVERHIKYFNTKIKHRFEKWLVRLGQYRPMVERVFAEFDLPLELTYLSLVESGFNPRAYSRARAAGPWQFMKATGRHYGLKVNYYVDERRDPMKSTIAAARYLRDLYDLFGDWHLAMAAYNAGEGKVGRALRRTKGTEFSHIAKSRYIRRETKEYVPRIMAATIIGRNPAQYGFNVGETTPHQYEEVVIPRPLLLRNIAKASGVSFNTLRNLNPELRRNVTPPNVKSYLLKVPVGKKVKVASVLSKIPTWKRKAIPRLKKHQKAPKGWYRVRWGDSLWKIAKRFRLSVRELKARNNLTGRLIKPGDLLAIRP